MLLAAVLLTFVNLLPGVRLPAARAAAEQQLEDIETRLRETRGEVDAVSRREGSLLDELHAASGRERELTAETQRLAARIAALEADVAANRGELERLDARLAGRRRAFSARLRARYLMRPLHVVAALSSPLTLTEKMRQLTYLQALLQADSEEIADYTDLLRRREESMVGLDRRRGELVGVRERQCEQLAALKESVAKKQRLLYNIRERKEYYQSLAAELEAAAAALKRIVEAHRVPPTAPPGSLADHQGRLPMPADGTVVRFFGRHRDRRFNTVTESRGIDIRAPAGAEVRAVFAGTVIFADRLRGYGNLVIVDHGEGFYSVYAHLQEMRVAVDRKLGQHEVLGLVGDTDSLAGTVLHFEIRRHGSPLDPLEWVSPMGPPAARNMYVYGGHG